MKLEHTFQIDAFTHCQEFEMNPSNLLPNYCFLQNTFTFVKHWCRDFIFRVATRLVRKDLPACTTNQADPEVITGIQIFIQQHGNFTFLTS